MISIKQISKHFGKEIVLRDISLDIEKGEIFGLIGKNGAGKTTLLSIIAGLSDVTKGSCYINGKQISKKNPYDKIGYLPDVPNFFDFMTVGEFIDFLYKKSNGYKNKRDELLKLVGLNKNTIIKTMSRGMKQRLGMAATLVNDPDIILLDEPSSALDPAGRNELSEILLNLKNEGKTIILSTHILTDMEQVCDRVAFLHNGNIVKILCPGNPGERRLKITFKNPVNHDIINNKSINVRKESDTAIVISGNLSEIGVQHDILSGLNLSGNPIVAVNTLGADLNDIFMEVCK